MINEHRFADRSAFFAALLQAVSKCLSAALKQHDRLTLFVSGGSTPAPLYQVMAQQKLDWSRISIALVDERWVPVDHQASNEALIRQTLLRDEAAGAAFQGMYIPRQDIAAATAICCRNYAALPQQYRLCILGMGPDGHTASLFPHAEGLQQAIQTEDCCAAIHARRSAVTGEHTERMSLTLRAILDMDRIFLLITGEEKWRIYQRAMQTEDKTDMPVSLLLQQQHKDIDIYWSP